MSDKSQHKVVSTKRDAIIKTITGISEMIDATYNSREASLAKTKLEEAAMWLEKCEDIGFIKGVTPNEFNIVSGTINAENIASGTVRAVKL